MSVQSEIERLSAIKAAIASALQTMGIEPPAGTTLEQYAAQLTAIAAAAPWMSTATYDPQGRGEDVFAAVDSAKQAAIDASRPADWMPTSADIDAVPTARKVNNKALSTDITLTAADVGAATQAYADNLVGGRAVNIETGTYVGTGTCGRILQIDLHLVKLLS